jgi:RsmE family RNA methyltransferase
MPGHFTFYCNKIEGDVAFFDEVESKHAIQVLRYGVGDEIHFTNGAGLSMRGTIENASKGGFSVRIFESIQINKPLELHMLMAILKAGDRMEWACEKITELGVTQFTLFQSDHGERGKVNLERLQKVALSAMKQSHGAWIPQIKVVTFKEAMEMAKRVSSSQANILITGESGSGKEVIAKAVHELGDKKDGPFIAINCSAIPENLLESELFGHAKGSFTGANDKKIGLFEEANKGTLFLDEIGDLSLPLQAKLLRVLQERKIKRIGENQFREISARIICATHKDLKKEVKEGRFREDLYFRLNVIPITMPPLRERKEDIFPLSEYFLKKFSLMNNTSVKGFTKDAILQLENYLWKGNVRELENAIERAVVLANTELIDASDLPQLDNIEPLEASLKTSHYIDLMPTASQPASLDEIARRYIQHVFDLNQGAKEQTAKDLGIDRKTLYRKLKEMNLN